MTTDPQTPVSPSNRRALVHNAITDALSKAGDWVPLSVRIAATRAALAEVDAWHADEPAPAGLGVSATPSHTDQAARRERYAAALLGPDVAGALDSAADEMLDAVMAVADAEQAELRRLADEARQPEPPVHGESVAHLAGYQPDGHDTRDGEQAGGQTPCGPAPDQCDAEAGDPCANHEREQAHDEGEHCFCGPECEGVPTGRHYEVHDETRPVCSCGRFWPCDLAIQPADDARQDGVQQ